MTAASTVVTVFTEDNSPETHYAFRILFDILLGIPWKITADKKSPNPDENFCLWYGKNQPDKAGEKKKGWMPASGFLSNSEFGFEPEIRAGKYPELFPVQENGAQMIHYDLPAAIFFLATEFAHYPPAKTDQYGRPDEAHSFIYKNKIHSYPLLHFYADSFFEVMQRSGYSGAKKERAFSYEITLDIDQPWKYLNKGFWVNAGGFFKDFLTGKFSNFSERMQVLFSGRDPYDVYALIRQNLPVAHTRFFFLVGNYSPNDSRFNPGQIAYANLIQKLTKEFGFAGGLHPSFLSSENPEILKEDAKQLRKVLPDFNSSRQHFLKYKPGETFRQLAAEGIQKEYSICPKTTTGFPTGMAIPYPWFDIQEKKESTLWIYPAQVMDRALERYSGFSPETAEKEILRMIATVKAINGNFILILHNETFSENGDWLGWKPVCLRIIEKLKSIRADAGNTQKRD